jgi:hypothetical protein
MKTFQEKSKMSTHESTGPSGMSLAAPNRTGLPDTLKSGVESLSGLSLDDVRVHYNSPQPVQLQAFAYTRGTEIHVAPGQERHLPHEAWHVVQQKQGRVKPTRSLNGMQINDEQHLEQEANVRGADSTRQTCLPPSFPVQRSGMAAGQATVQLQDDFTNMITFSDERGKAILDQNVIDFFRMREVSSKWRARIDNFVNNMMGPLAPLLPRILKRLTLEVRQTLKMGDIFQALRQHPRFPTLRPGKVWAALDRMDRDDRDERFDTPAQLISTILQTLNDLSKERFFKNYQKHRSLKIRGPLPADRRVHYEPGQITLERRFPDGDLDEVGSVGYRIGRLPATYVSPNLQSNAPGLVNAPAILMIQSFFSSYEHTIKGIGGALLNAIVKMAELRECPFIVVLGSTNDEVYEAFDFLPADKAVGTWYASTAFMKTRTRSYATPTTDSGFD